MITVIIIFAVIAVLVGADQMIKVWAIENLQNMPERPFLQIGSFDWMHLRYIENSGAAFSMLSGSRIFLIAFPLIMITACLYLLHRLGKTHRWLYAALPLIAAGGIGNLIDRVIRGGKVVDYLDLQLFRFAVFNFADVCVTVGVAILIICVLFFEKEVPDAKPLKKAKRVPYLHTVEEAGELPEAETLPEAALLPDAEPAKLIEDAKEQDHAGA